MVEPYNIVIENTETDELSNAEIIKKLKKEIEDMKEKMEAMAEKAEKTGPIYRIKSTAPKKFTGAEEYREWAQEFKIYATQIHPKMKRALTWAEDRKPEEITEDSFDAQGLGLEYEGLVEAAENAILGNIGREAWTLVMAQDQGNGLRMWSRLKERYDQDKSAEIRTILGRISRPQRASTITNTPAIIDILEKDVQRYELLSGRTIPEDLKIEAVFQICPIAIVDQVDLQRGLGHGDTYMASKKLMLHMAMLATTRAKTKTAKEVNSMEESEERSKRSGQDEGSEEVFEFKRTEKGKPRQKGQQKGQRVSTGKGKDGKGVTSTTCFTCGKVGHLARDCWSSVCWTCQGVGTHVQTCPRAWHNRVQDKGQTKGKGPGQKGKGKGNNSGKGKGYGKGGKNPTAGEPLWSYTGSNNWGPEDQGTTWQDDAWQYSYSDDWSTEDPHSWIQEEKLTAIFKHEELKEGSRFRQLEDEEVAALEDRPKERRAGQKNVFRTIVDSGASESVLPTNHEFVGVDTLSESPKKGTKYAAANGSTTLNQGQVKLRMTTWEGRRGDLSYQVTGVSQSLTSVARLCDLGNTVTFDTEGGDIINAQTGRRTRFERKGGVYVLEVEAEAAEAPIKAQCANILKTVAKENPFHRQAQTEL